MIATMIASPPGKYPSMPTTGPSIMAAAMQTATTTAVVSRPASRLETLSYDYLSQNA
jgi:hypothetical protein